MPGLSAWFEQLTRKNWSKEQISAMLGSQQRCVLAYAAEPAWRERSASGGAVSVILSHLLESGQIDGALVNEAYVESGIVKNRFFIARTVEELHRSQGSKYQTVHFSSQALPLIRTFEGKLAVVALPCDAAILRRQCEKEEALNAKIHSIITLFCAHTSQPELTKRIVDRVKAQESLSLTDFHYKSGHWRGNMTFAFGPEHTLQIPYGRYSLYQNLFFFCDRKCLNCHDQFGYAGDISAGDIWLESMKTEAIKHTALIARTDCGSQTIAECETSGALVVKESTANFILQGQSRTVRCHYNTSARHRVGKLLRIAIPDSVHTRVSLIDWLIAFIVLFNYRLSTTKLGKKIIFTMPKIVWKAYLYFFKALESM